MLNRRHIRIKVMQTLYAFNGSESDDFVKDQKFLLYSMENMYNLYLLMISILIEIQEKAKIQIEKAQNKHLATHEDKNPNRKFVNNELLALIKANTSLLEEIESNKFIDWELDSEYIDIIYKSIVNSELYKDYMSTKVSTFKEDKNFIIDVYKEIIAPNDKLYDYIEDKNLTWLDDLPTINTVILKLLRKVRHNSDERYFKSKLYKDIDDKDFGVDLFKKTLLNTSVLQEEIDKKTKNWDSERIASIDYILLKMGLAELKHFPSIPVKVTINEYLEIAKEYSTPKSSIFINGVLDKLVKEYTEAGKLNKVGRGLM